MNTSIQRNYATCSTIQLSQATGSVLLDIAQQEIDSLCPLGGPALPANNHIKLVSTSTLASVEKLLKREECLIVEKFTLGQTIFIETTDNGTGKVNYYWTK